MKNRTKAIAYIGLLTLVGQLSIACDAPPLESGQSTGDRAFSEKRVTPSEESRSRTAEQLTNTAIAPSTRSSSEIVNISPRPASPTRASRQVDPLLEEENAETYDRIEETGFKRATNAPFSTFSIDVDTASYSNVRRFINNGQTPPKDAVRIEELINYFNYEYPQPRENEPFSIATEVSRSPWNPQHQLVHIGIQGKKIATEDLPPSNLVFLIDVSGSMTANNKLPLLKSAFKLLVGEMRPEDTVSIVVYAGAAGIVLPPTFGDRKDVILTAIDRLAAGGSTAGGEGIKLAYKLVKENFKRSGNNRVILATDGDFNVGISSDTELVQLIEEKRKDNIFLTVLGVGMGNLQDSKMEKLADKGNGNYAYIDNELEAKKVLVKEMGGTLLTIAKDVKIQVDFNPAKVKAYRLIGYENRRLKDEDFNDDTKDAGELGAGHTVTALYEIVPVGAETNINLPDIDASKYQQSEATNSNELMEVKLRYKQPDGDTSQLIAYPVSDVKKPFNATSANFKFSAAVASFGMVLRDSPYKGQASFAGVLELAKESQGVDLEGYRAEFIRLVQASQKLAKK
ncbi:MAG: VWA domain-containing protein [Cyanobacteria bacterium SBLK]|nr:VWA domain-containing protein [Cyanobacteria bacterium SBLK]